MSLSGRQRWAYRDTVDVYEVAGYDVNAARSVKQPTYSSSPKISNLKCRIQTTEFRNGMLNPLGRSQLDNFETEDFMHCELGTGLEDGDVVIVTTSGSPLNDKAYKVIGKAESRIGRANYDHVHLRLLDVKPANIT